MPKTLLDSHQRDIIRADTMIDRMIIDRCVDAFDALVKDDKHGYIQYMGTATLMIGEGAPRPTAVDVMKTILTRAYADRQGVSFKQAHARLQAALRES